MRIIKYNTEIDSDKKTILVKESSKNYPEIESLSTPSKIADMFNYVFRARYQSEEVVWILALNTKCSSIGVFEVSRGYVNCSLLRPREVFMKLLLCGAVNFVLVHTHPSGETTPSRDDIKITKSIKEIGNMMGIVLLDHIIIGDTYWSFAEKKMI